MHYYQFNIGDYASHTRHLTPIEDIVYRRLLDAYYLQERALNTRIAAVARQICMRDCEKEVEIILLEFFVLAKHGWTNPRADNEIAKYHSKSEQASRAGKASVQSKINARSTDVQPNKKQEPLNIKQETSKYTPPIGDKLLSDWLEVRKAKRAGKLTETAFKGLEREARLAGLTAEQAVQVCCERGWQSFKADWHLKKESVQEARLDTARQIMGVNYGNDRTIRDITPTSSIESSRARISKTFDGIWEPDVSEVARAGHEGRTRNMG